MLGEHWLSQVTRSAWGRHTCGQAAHPTAVWREAPGYSFLEPLSPESYHLKCAKDIVLVPIWSGQGKAHVYLGCALTFRFLSSWLLLTLLP